MQDRIRRYVDGELSAADAAALERQLAAHPDLQTHVQFELHLRHRVQAVMQAQARETAPAELRSTIEGLLSAPAQEDAAVAAGPRSAKALNNGQASRNGARRSWLAEPRRVNYFAVAACLALVAGAVLFGIFAPQITSFRLSQPKSTLIDISQTAAPFAADEHSRCASNAEFRKQKLEFVDIEIASHELGEHLESHVVVPSFNALGYEFIGAGRCNVPVGEPSAHAIYRSKGPGERRPYLSVFIFADRGQFMLKEHGSDVPLKSGKPCEAGRNPKCHRKVKVFSDGEVVYVVSGCDQEKLEGAVQLLEDALAAARPLD